MSEYSDGYFTTQDGLSLHYRDYPGDVARGPVICLGAAGTVRQFHDIAVHIAPGRRVLCLEGRGRGQSAHHPNPANYTMQKEASDLGGLMRAAGIKKAVLLGTSRGGLIALTLAARRNVATGLILNDAGPDIELGIVWRQLARLAANTSHASWEDAAAMLKRQNGDSFTNMTERKWLDWARAIYREEGGRVVLDADPRLLEAGRAAAAALPGAKVASRANVWPDFVRMPPIPMLVLRGEHSAFLLPETVMRMQALKRDLTAVTVNGRGHAPFLDEPEAVAAIDRFLGSLP
jgi:pimeloyl-ACP methyl ester carboxylesterase